MSLLDPKPEPQPIVPSAEIDKLGARLHSGTEPAPLVLQANPDSVEAWRRFGPHLATFLGTIRVEQGYRDAVYALAAVVEGLPEAEDEDEEEDVLEAFRIELAQSPDSDHDDRMPEAV